MPYNLFYYCHESGSCPFLEWLEEQEAGAQIRILARIEKLLNVGNKLHEINYKPLGSGLFELRPVYRDVQYRVLFFFNGKEVIVITGGFKKKTQKTPKGEIEKALERMKRIREKPEKHLTTG